MSVKTIERIKTLTIAALLISTGVLGYFSSLFNSLSSAFSSGSSVAITASGVEGSAFSVAARPAVIAMTNASGARAVVKYDMDALDSMYERPTSSLFSEALTVCTEARACTEAEWRTALGSTGVMYEYFSYMPLELVRDWLGAPGDGFGLSVLRICLAYSEDGAALYFESESGFFTAATSAPSGDFFVNAVFSSDLKYGFERDDKSTSPYLILTSDYTHPVAISTNPLYATSLDKALAGLRIDIRQATSYPDSDGTENYISSLFTLSITTDGIVNYRRSLQESASVNTTLSAATQLAGRAASATIGANSGEARVYFSGFVQNGDAYTIYFNYYFAGGRVFLSGVENAASITVSNGMITEFTLCCRTFSSGERMALLPEEQASAIRPAGFALGYSDSGSSAPFWYSVRSEDGI